MSINYGEGNSPDSLTDRTMGLVCPYARGGEPIAVFKDRASSCGGIQCMPLQDTCIKAQLGDYGWFCLSPSNA
ncbi:MAG: hypothetical protein N3E38_02280, partial [Candidatus Aenigmarchaeota archaeon]|nr:hypothetical protein [Candidatus Aenigmarchaeota archaeon]